MVGAAIYHRPVWGEQLPAAAAKGRPMSRESSHCRAYQERAGSERMTYGPFREGRTAERALETRVAVGPVMHSRAAMKLSSLPLPLQADK